MGFGVWGLGFGVWETSGMQLTCAILQVTSSAIHSNPGGNVVVGKGGGREVEGGGEGRERKGDLQAAYNPPE